MALNAFANVFRIAELRNRLAYTIFAAVRTLGGEDVLPWDALGLPVALIGCAADGRPLFTDGAAVVRAGGRPQRRSAIFAGAGSPFLWQARIAFQRGEARRAILWARKARQEDPNLAEAEVFLRELGDAG